MAKKRAAKRSTRQSNRVPVGGQRQRMTVHDKEDGYVYRWVNDDPGRLQRYLDAGYEFVESDTGVGEDQQDHGQPVDSTVSMQVGRTRYATNGQAYLMRIRQEYYDEDQEAKREHVRETERSMFRADPNMGQYVKEQERNRS